MSLYKRKKQITSIRNKIGGNTGHLMEIKRIINECYEQLYDHKFDNLVEVDQYLC